MAHVRHERVWHVLYEPLRVWLTVKFGLETEDLAFPPGPCVIIPNHASAWDPLFVAIALRRRQAYFVASEHLFRLGRLSEWLRYLVGPIPRRKADSGADTVKAMLRHLQLGHAICLFAEGEQCWDGRTAPIFPATGKLLRRSGASLLTVRIRGSYLSRPRWGRTNRRGIVTVAPVQLYSPADLQSMTPAAINDAIARDISEDTWVRQAQEPVAFRGKALAEGLERAVFLCPRCRRIDTMRTREDRITCTNCQFTRRFTPTGFFVSDRPFAHIAAWDDFQHRALRKRAFISQGDAYFQDDPIELSTVDAKHEETLLATGTLWQYPDRLQLDAYTFLLTDIADMSTVQSHLLVFRAQGRYWQLRTRTGANLRKYLMLWETSQPE